MECVDVKSAEKASSERDKEYSGRKATEIATGIEFNIVKVFYETGEVYKKRVLSYPVFVSLSNDETKKRVKLDDFKKMYNLLD